MISSCIDRPRTIVAAAAAFLMFRRAALR